MDGTLRALRALDLTFAPRATTVITFRLKTPGTPYWRRPDLGLSREDVTVEPGGRALRVTVHSLGSVPAPATRLGFRDAQGRLVAAAAIGPMEAPVDLRPRTAAVRIILPEGVTAEGGSVEIDPDHALEEITELNNRVSL